jgi:hypothetical protein
VWASWGVGWRRGHGPAVPGGGQVVAVAKKGRAREADSHRARRLRSLTVSTVVLGVAVAGLGTGRAAAGSPATEPTTQTILHAGVLQATDVPAGWASIKVPDRSNASPAALQGRVCRTARSALQGFERVPNAFSRLFVDPTSPQGSDGTFDLVGIYPSSAEAAGFVARISGPGAGNCLATVDASAHIKVVTVAPISSVVQGVTFLGLEVRGGFGSQTLTEDQFNANIGRVVLRFDVHGVGSGGVFPTELPLAEATIASVLTRLASIGVGP